MSRIAAAPLLAAVFYLPAWTGATADMANLAAAAFFGLAAATDFADGYLARRTRQRSRIGEVLDPTADKILVITALLLLLEAGRAPVIACWLIIARDVAMSGVREWAAPHYAKATKVSMLGKIKTGVQIAAILFLLGGDSVLDLPLAVPGIVLLWIAAALSVLSLVGYCSAIWKASDNEQQTEKTEHEK